MKYTRKDIYASLYCGSSITILIMALWQDIIGKEEYIQMIKSNWLETVWWMWLLLLIPYCLYVKIILLDKKRQ